MAKQPRLTFRIGTVDPSFISDQVADMDLTVGIIGVLQDLVLALAARWDEPPICGPLLLRSRMPVGADTVMHGIGVEFEPFVPMTPMLARAERQHQLLVAMAETYQKHAIELLPPEMIAMVLVNEAWMTYLDTADEEAKKRLKKAAQDHRLSERPERVEVKQALAVDINGIIYMVQKARGGKSNYMAGPYGTDQAIGSDVPDGLEYLTYALMGKTLPPWTQWQEKEWPWRSGTMDSF